MRKIYVSDSGNDIGDGLTHKTPIRSWKRFIELCEGNDEIIIMGNADTGKIETHCSRLIRKVASLKARLLRRPLSCDRTSLTLTRCAARLEKVIMDIALPKIARLWLMLGSS